MSHHTAAVKLFVDIYRSRKREGLYLYVKRGQSLDSVPDGLVQRFGKAELAMSLLLHDQRRLANADIDKVMQSILVQGYYLQLPPVTRPSP